MLRDVLVVQPVYELDLEQKDDHVYRLDFYVLDKQNNSLQGVDGLKFYKKGIVTLMISNNVPRSLIMINEVIL